MDLSDSCRTRPARDQGQLSLDPLLVGTDGRTERKIHPSSLSPDIFAELAAVEGSERRDGLMSKGGPVRPSYDAHSSPSHPSGSDVACILSQWKYSVRRREKDLLPS